MKTYEPGEVAADILVVDDTHANLQLLTNMLKQRGYTVRPALNGELAIQAARRSPPDIILLDINMPGLSGYEVATLLKEDEKLREIPILFLSALSETLDKVRAFNAGGVDYIVKPFQFEEVAARVNTHLKIRNLQREVQRRNEELAKRNHELHELQELRDNLVHMIIHDLRSPLAIMRGNLDLFNMTDADKISSEGANSIQKARESASRMIEMVNSLLDVNKMEAGQLQLCPTPCDLAALSRETLSSLEPLRLTRTFEVHVPETPIVASLDRDLISRVLQNLLGNALKHAPNGSAIRLEIQPTGSGFRLSIADMGKGIAPEFQSRLFTKFGQVNTRGKRVGTGLGLVFCKLAVEAHGGRIGVESEVGKGSNFWFEIPTSIQV